MSKSLAADVMVVGAGPAGAACAAILADRGVDVLVIDRAVFPRHKICGDCINPRAWRSLREIGVDGQVRSRISQVLHGAQVHTIGGRTVTVGFENDPQRPWFVMKRSDFDSILVAHARTKNVQVWEGVTVRRIRWDGKWRLSTDRGEAAAGFLVGADGRNSAVARVVGKRRELRKDRVAIQWHCRYQKEVGSRVEMFLFRSGYAGIVNVDAQSANVALVTTGQHVRLLRRGFEEFFGNLLFENQHARMLFASLEPMGEVIATFPVNPVSSASGHPSAFLAGDARQTVEPFTGEGISFALEDGIRTANRILLLMNRRPCHSGVPSQNSFWANQVYSRLLRVPPLASAVVASGVLVPFLVPLAVQPLFPRRLA